MLNSLKSINDMKDRIMNFEGGIRDQFLSADGTAVNPLNQGNINRQFVVTITNPMAVRRDVYLTPGPNYSTMLQLLALQRLGFGVTIEAKAIDGTNPAAAIPLTAALEYTQAPGYLLDGECFGINEASASNTAMTVNSSPRTIQDFFNFINCNPTTLTQMKINDNIGDGQQNNYPLEVFELTPFRQLASKVINPSFYVTQNSMNQNNVLFETPDVILSNQTMLKYSIAPAVTINGSLVSRTITITFNCGVTLNTADALDNKITDAKMIAASNVATKLLK